MAKRIKLFGERHTNTNYVSRLIELNLDCELIEGVVPRLVRTAENFLGEQWLRDLYFKRTESANLGWKHAAVPRGLDGAGVCFVTLTKNPYAWLISMHRRPYHQRYDKPPSLEEFVTLPWRTVGRERVDGPVANPVQLWNLKNRSYKNLPAERTLQLTTESTFADASAVIERIAVTFDIPRTNERFVDFQRSTKKRSGRDGDYYRDYYLNERWRRELSDAAIASINKELDAELVAYFGYDLL